MKMITRLIVFLAFDSLISCTNLPEYLNTDTFYFNYGGTPQTQFDRFPECFNKKRQSPIDVNYPLLVDPSAKIILSNSWNTPRKNEIFLNTGHKPQVVDALSEPRRYVTFKGVKYQFANRHFHYGSANDNSIGSEHALFGRKYPLEAHTFFFKAEYGSKDEADKHSDGILEMAELYQIGEARSSFERLLNNLHNIAYPNQTVALSLSEIPSQVIPFNSKFYYFQGSSSGPKCEENTLWIIFDEIQSLSMDQMNRFRNVLRTVNGTLQIKSWRYLQDRNDRKIYSGQGSEIEESNSGPDPDDFSSIDLNEYFEVVSG